MFVTVALEGAQLEGQNLGYGWNPEVLPGGETPEESIPKKMTKVGGRLLL